MLFKLVLNYKGEVMEDLEYKLLALNTEANNYDDIIDRLKDPTVVRLLHAAMGLSTESGEFMDAMKKHIFYGQDLDTVNLAEETGDQLWYVAIAIDALKTTFKEVKTKNIAKLRARFPDSFTKYDAMNRDLDAERKILEDDK
jgi:NTP pyrophosphatase (non-canonical NTP hydrolase)